MEHDGKHHITYFQCARTVKYGEVTKNTGTTLNSFELVL